MIEIENVSYATIKEAAKSAGYAESWISELCRQGRISGVRRIGRAYLVPLPVEVIPVPQGRKKVIRDLSM